MHRFVLPRSEHLRVALEKVENVSRKGGPLDKIVRECTEHYDLRVSPLFPLHRNLTSKPVELQPQWLVRLCCSRGQGMKMTRRTQ